MIRSRIRFTETASGERIVHKRCDDHRLLAAEVEALRAFGEHRAAIVREAHVSEGFIVLEHVTPGTTLAAAATEDDALDAVGWVLARRWPEVPDGSAAQPLSQFAEALDRARSIDARRRRPIDDAHVQRASAIFKELLEGAPHAALLHGDLHYDNILVSDRAGHLLIDPKGVIGDPAFDVGYLVSRPSPQASDTLPFGQAVERRLAVLPEATGQDAQRVAAFAYVAAVLSACWALEDGDRAVYHYVAAAAALEHHLPS